MATSEQLRKNIKQHKAKNIQSKGDEKKVLEAMNKVIVYLGDRLELAERGYELEYIKSIKLSELIDIIGDYLLFK